MPRSLIHGALVALTCAVLPAATAGQDASTLTRLETGDDTRGWEAVGRLNFGRSGFCTGALISETRVLTAAHCLFDSDTGDAVDIADMEFLVGLRDGRAEAYRGVRRAVMHPDYVFGNQVELRRVAVDLAIIELDRPVRTGRIVPFKVGFGPMEGEPVGVVSYAKDRSEAPSLQRECHVLETKSGVVMLSCAVDFGASGAPVFRFGANGPTIVSVVSAKANADGENVSLASAFGARFAELQAAFEAAHYAGSAPRVAESARQRGLDLGGTESTTELPPVRRAVSGGGLNRGSANVRQLETAGGGVSSTAKFLRP